MIATESIDGSQLTAYARKTKEGVKIEETPDEFPGQTQI